MDHELNNAADETPENAERSGVSRRQFLKMAGLAGAAVSVGGGLGGLLAACGGDEETTTSTATAPSESTTTTGAASTDTTAGPTTTAGVEGGREIKVGVVAPLTGALASFAAAANWQIERWNEALADGVVCGDNKNHKIKVIQYDSQSDTNRAAQVAGDLVQNDGVDVILVSSSPDTVNPVADQCEALACPMIASFVPWQPFFFGRGGAPDKPFKWTYAHGIGVDKIMDVFLDMWEKIPTNKKVGLFFANDDDGNSWVNEETGIIPGLKAGGYEYVLPGQHTVPTEDFTKQISEFKKFGAEIVAGSVISPDFTNFWKQAIQQDFKPKILTIGKALLFPQSLEATGEIAANTTVELVWHPSWPFKSSLTGETCQEMADDYEKRTGQQWTAPIGQYGRMEWLVDSLKRCPNVDDKEEIIKAISTAKLETLLGPIDLTQAPDMAPGSMRPVQNVYCVPLGGGQWVKGTKYQFDIVEVSNKWVPTSEVTAEMLPMQYS